MIARPIKDIKHELKIVDERIHSKKILLKEFPEDVGLQLSIMDFEGRKEDLIRELADAKNKYNIITFDINLYSPSKDPITLNVLGDISNKFNEVVRSFLMTMKGPVKKRATRLLEIVDKFKLQVDAVQTGSLKITLSEAENTERFEYSPLRDALIKLNELIDCGDNQDLIINKLQAYGNKPIYTYKQFLNTISEHDLNLKLYENVKPENFEMKEITHNFATSVYKVIDKAQESIIEEFTFNGMLYLVNIDALKFGIKKGQKNYIGSFDKKLKSKVKLNLDEEVTVLLEKTIEPHEVEGVDSIKYKLLKFLD